MAVVLKTVRTSSLAYHALCMFCKSPMSLEPNLCLQGVFFALYMLFYSLSARHCHAFVGRAPAVTVHVLFHGSCAK